MDGSEEKKLAGEDDQFGDDYQITEADLLERDARAMAKKKRELHDRRVERLQWSLIRLKLDIADTSARLKYQKKLGAELDGRLAAAVAAAVAAL